MENDTDIERISTALDPFSETSPEQLRYLQVSAMFEIALQIAKLRRDIESITGCVGDGKVFTVQVYGQ